MTIVSRRFLSAKKKHICTQVTVRDILVTKQVRVRHDHQ